MDVPPTLPPYAASLATQLDCPAPWRAAVTAALAGAGVVVADEAPTGIAVAPGRTVSETVDAWSVDSLPHLLVAVWPGAVEVGPWVAPGMGPCARCVAASVLDEGTRARHGRPERGHLALAAGVAARDAAGWARGERPHTWATSWRWDHEPVPRSRRWRQHPYCGCDWFDTA